LKEIKSAEIEGSRGFSSGRVLREVLSEEVTCELRGEIMSLGQPDEI